MKVRAHEWMNEDGELDLISETQKKLAQSPTAQRVLSQYRFFKENGLATSAQEIRNNVNNAMEIAYERDTDFAPNERFDIENNRLGF
ncbi:hypothetical protein OQJ19_13270 [Fluoribacter gormanii]|uniref:Uncharacterized protein n=1 Tax=Fluoribacter gormanii TaxID=464 RepID=A0A377GKC6_9GAMM|nr:hypothetical protein [Fluoribacter gormanii]KTD05419.1 hypothetical protein Lgor_0409 [Fluoribacter gormanii]MCW8443185.1 hypothetical protein [Fluoribacter gormanii]MCW8471609.1 hypothetical protein [Fluoribacter gormanii]SIR61576.1 hypothetical protein SAMN05421777_1179 [Fluoribacter gormanii]STO25279.1 Uncharacterised protein [Fluoribacter gormanii]